MEDDDNFFGEGYDIHGKPLNAKPKKKKQNRNAVVPTKKTRPKKLNSDAKVKHETDFAAAILSGMNNTQAYLTIYPDTHPENARNYGNKFRKRTGVVSRIKEGKDAAVHELRKAALYDLQKAYEELCMRIERADAADQHSAVATMLTRKLEMTKLIGKLNEGGLSGGARIEFIDDFGETETEKVKKIIDQTSEGEDIC